MLNKPDPSAGTTEPVVVKKYANRRLYNTETSTYVTLDDLAAMVREERDFVVFDAKSGNDLTHAVLTQIIVEQESRAGTETLLPVPFLRQLIRFYGDTMQRMVPSYLQVSMESLAKEQERFRAQMPSNFTPQAAFDAYQEHLRKNLALFEQAMSMWKPTLPGQKAGTADENDPVKAPAGTPRAAAVHSAASSQTKAERAAPAPKNTELDELKAQLAAMQAKLEKILTPGDKS